MWSKSVAQMMREPEKAVDAFVKSVAVDGLSMVQSRTPVDTGRARQGWSIEKTRTGYLISNNVTYIVPLEYGHSSQAPAGMARVTAATLNAKYQIGATVDIND